MDSIALYSSQFRNSSLQSWATSPNSQKYFKWTYNVCVFVCIFLHYPNPNILLPMQFHSTSSIPVFTNRCKVTWKTNLEQEICETERKLFIFIVLRAQWICETWLEIQIISFVELEAYNEIDEIQNHQSHLLCPAKKNYKKKQQLPSAT